MARDAPCGRRSISKALEEHRHVQRCAAWAALDLKGAMKSIVMHRDAPRGRRSISKALEEHRHAQRCAARAALDLEGAARRKAGTHHRNRPQKMQNLNIHNIFYSEK
ncbi:hypothetical protein ACIP1T_27425 [Pseudomonas japonica]|uniref:hypothetical protein n=1 Tax=Pseudomonas japonica TaxID=256466 RepID=UPI0037FD88BE